MIIQVELFYYLLKVMTYKTVLKCHPKTRLSLDD